jgi:hypothetical protein
VHFNPVEDPGEAELECLILTAFRGHVGERRAQGGIPVPMNPENPADHGL